MKDATFVAVASVPIADWHQKSLSITSTARSDAMGPGRFSKGRQTAKNPRGGKAGPPTPAYMIQAEDADAIAAYLKSLP
jgi:hypothetical protein